MDKIKKLDEQLKSAMVKETDEGVYTVYVPGAVRQHNVVKASSEKEALQKVRKVLVVKVKHFANKSVSTDGENTKLEVQSTVHKNKSEVKQNG